MDIVQAMTDLGAGAPVRYSRDKAHMACPRCGGTDRLVIYLVEGRVYCPHCDLKGNLPQVLQEVLQLGRDAAMAMARGYGYTGLGTPSSGGNGACAKGTTDRAAWNAAVLASVERWVGALAASRDAAAGLSRSRGINASSQRLFRLGLVEREEWHDRAAFGLPSALRADGHPATRFRIPAGIAIPCLGEDGAINGVLVRLETGGHAPVGTRDGVPMRYYWLPGSRPASMLFPPREGAVTNVLIWVESFLCGMVMNQETGAGIVSLGGVNAPVSKVCARAARSADINLLCFDNDDAGARATETLLADYPNSAACPIPDEYGKDLSDGYLCGLDLRAFLRAGMEIAGVRPVIAAAGSRVVEATVVPPSAPVTGAPGGIMAAVRDMVAAGGTVGIAVTVLPLDGYADHPKAGWSPSLSRIAAVTLVAHDRRVEISDGESLAQLPELLDPLRHVVVASHEAAGVLRHLLPIGVRLGRLDDTSVMWHLLSGETSSAVKNPLALPRVLQQVLNVEVAGDANGLALVPVLRDTLLDRLRAEGLEPCYDQLRGTLLAVARLETNGMPFDADAHGARLVEWRGQLADARADLNRLLGTGVDPDKPEQIRDALRAVLSAEEIASWPTTRKTRLLSTEASAFEARPDLPVSGPLLRHRKYSKLVSAFGDKLASFIDPVTGCIHAEFHLTRTDTGRMACSSPALQAVPRDNEFRELFRAPTGRIIKADYSQIEILISAQIALENVILDAHARGADLHNLTAALLLNVPPDEVSKEQRQLAKAINFSLLYGGGAKNLMEAASAKYAIQMTEQEAQQFRRDFFTAYPRLRAFQQESVKTAKRLGFVRTKGGRVRRFGAKDNVHTMAGNAIVQGTGAALIQRALALVVRRLAHEDIKAQLTHVVHDEIVIWASDDAVEAARAVLVKAMEDAWLELFPGASTRNLVQCTVGRSWGASE